MVKCLMDVLLISSLNAFFKSIDHILSLGWGQVLDVDWGSDHGKNIKIKIHEIYIYMHRFSYLFGITTKCT